MNKQNEKNYTDKVEPKFKVGDKIVEDNEFGMVGGEITDIDNTHYELNGGGIYIPISHQDNYKLVEEKKSSDKIEPKFKKGDWIINNDKRIAVPIQILKIEKYGYVTSRGYTSFDKVKTEYHLWTIQEAKNGDVLALNSEYFLFKEKKNSTTESYISHCFIDSAKTFRENGEFLPIERGNKVCPTTKEQYDLLFSKMKEAGYEWDAEKKELKKIEQKPAENTNNVCPQTLDEAIDLYYYSYGNGNGYFENLSFEKFKDIVKTFVNDYGKQNPAWSEEDEYQFNTILHELDLKRELYKKEGNQVEEKRYKTQYDWFKSFKPNHWKPSNLEIESLNIAIGNQICQNIRKNLEQLLNNLKKL